MPINASNNSVSDSTMSTFTPVAPSQELLDSLRFEWEEKNPNTELSNPPVLRRETSSDYIIDSPTLVRQDTLILPPPTLTRERPEDYLFDPNSFISPDRIHNIQMPGTPVANRNSDRDLSHIRPRRLHFN